MGDYFKQSEALAEASPRTALPTALPRIAINGRFLTQRASGVQRFAAEAIKAIDALLDTDYAERADYAFGEYRYFPGAGRQVFVELGAVF